MNILIICSFFPPDSAVAAVRPYMFAKYLSESGNHVTVLRSGEFYHQPDNSYDSLNQNVQIITYLGKDSPAEKYRRGEYNSKASAGRGRIKKMPLGIRKAGRFCLEPWITIKDLTLMRKKYQMMKKAIDQLKDREWDIVFSTYGELENIWGGQYAAEVLHAKWIQDFRDAVIWYKNSEKYTWNIYARSIQKKAVIGADLCTTVSDGLKEKLLKDSLTDNVITLYNGYEENKTRTTEEITVDPEHLTICYLGSLYSDDLRALNILLDCIKETIDSGDISINRIKFIYGGSNEEEVKDAFDKHQMTSVLESVGYVDRNTVQKIQMEADLFLVLTWNTKNSQGILSGKLYEGIKARKPILAVVTGNVPGSELFRMINKFQYGCCYEESMNKAQRKNFQEYIRKMYEMKIQKGKIDFKPDVESVQAFRYDHLTQKLENMMRLLTQENGDLE